MFRHCKILELKDLPKGLHSDQKGGCGGTITSRMLLPTGFQCCQRPHWEITTEIRRDTINFASSLSEVFRARKHHLLFGCNKGIFIGKNGQNKLSVVVNSGREFGIAFLLLLTIAESRLREREEADSICPSINVKVFIMKIFQKLISFICIGISGSH